VNGRERRAGWRLLGRELASTRGAVFAVAGWSLVESVPVLLSGRLVELAIDRGFAAGRFGVGFGWLAVFGLTLIVGATGSRAVVRRIGCVVEPLRDTLVRLVVTGTLTRSAAAMASPDRAGVARLCRQVETVRDVVAGLLITTTQFTVTSVAVIAGVGSLAPQAALLVAGPLAAAVALFAALVRPMVARQLALFLTEERLTCSAAETFAAMRDIVACGAEAHIASCVAALIDAQVPIAKDLALLGMLRKLAVAVGCYLPMGLILVSAGALIRHGLSVGALVGALVYVSVNLQPALQALVEGGGNSAQRLAVALGRIVEMSTGGNTPALSVPGSGADQGPHRAVAPEAGRAHRGEGQPACAGEAGLTLELRDVNFGYGLRATPVVRNLNLVVAAGGHLAVVGPSGIGKSTVANLMAGLLAPDSGEIRLCGRPLGGIGGKNLRLLRTLIPQEAYVFAGTLRDNLVYLRPDAVQSDVDAAVDLLGIRAMAERHGGLDADISPDALSAGERQLVALCRAYLSPARLTILDEATCHLDPAAEGRVERAFRERPGTVVIIAHRISSARRADLILVMGSDASAQAAAPASHRELLASCPAYAELVASWHGDELGPPLAV
jgi:ATP-binding cassette subfamily C protein